MNLAAFERTSPFIFKEASPFIVGLGIFVSLVWTRRTGWSCGGIITPGLLALALYASSPARALPALALGAVLTPLLSLCARVWGLYGRERVGAAMLLALLARGLLVFAAPFSFHALGWVIPGLIAADADRQGLLMTLCGVFSCTLFTVFCITLFQACGAMFL